MANDLIKIINCETGEEIERQMTDDEQAVRDADKATYLADKTAKEVAQNEAAASKTQLLEKLGITEDEARLLLS
jgi:hypothetical protein